VVDDQLKKLAGVDVPVLALVLTALHVQKSLMQAEKCERRESSFSRAGESLFAGYKFELGESISNDTSILQ